MNIGFEQIGCYEIGDIVSNVVWHKQKQQADRIYLGDWSGNLHFLRLANSRLTQLKNKEKIMENPILSIDRKKGKDQSNPDTLLVGSGNGELSYYDIVTQKLLNICTDNENRPLAKVISIQDCNRIFSFTWNRTMLVCDDNSGKTYNHKLQENYITAEYAHPYIVVIFGDNSIAFINVTNYGMGSAIKRKPIGFTKPIKTLTLYNNSIEYMALGDIFGNIKILKLNPSLANENFYNVTDQLIDKDYSVLFEYQAHVHCIDSEEDDKDLTVLFPVHGVDFDHRDPNIVFTAGGDKAIVMTNVEKENGKKIRLYNHSNPDSRFTRPIKQLKWNDDGKALLTVESDDLFPRMDSSEDYSVKTIVRVLKTNADY